MPWQSLIWCNHDVEDNKIYFKNRNGSRETLLLRAMSGIVEVDCKDSYLKPSTSPYK